MSQIIPPEPDALWGKLEAFFLVLDEKLDLSKMEQRKEYVSKGEREQIRFAMQELRAEYLKKSSRHWQKIERKHVWEALAYLRRERDIQPGNVSDEEIFVLEKLMGRRGAATLAGYAELGSVAARVARYTKHKETSDRLRDKIKELGGETPTIENLVLAAEIVQADLLTSPDAVEPKTRAQIAHQVKLFAAERAKQDYFAGRQRVHQIVEFLLKGWIPYAQDRIVELQTAGAPIDISALFMECIQSQPDLFAFLSGKAEDPGEKRDEDTSEGNGQPTTVD